MAAQSDPPAGDGLEHALVGALDAVLARRATGQDRVELLKGLRSQLEKVLTEAPISEDALAAIAFRVRLAALCDAEITRLERALCAAIPAQSAATGPKWPGWHGSRRRCALRPKGVSWARKGRPVPL